MLERQQPHAKPDRTAVVYRVTSLEGDTVIVQVEQSSAPGVAHGSKRESTFSRKAPPTLGRWLHEVMGIPASALKVDEKVRVGDASKEIRGRAFRCKVVGFEASMSDGKGSIVLEGWFAPEVKGSSIASLALTAISGFPAQQTTVKQTVAGFGTKDAVTWGAKFEEIDVGGKDR